MHAFGLLTPLALALLNFKLSTDRPSVCHSFLEPVQETLDVLKSVKCAVSVVAGVGPQRLGKSTILNLFHSRKTSGFGLGHTLDAQTTGENLRREASSFCSCQFQTLLILSPCSPPSSPSSLLPVSLSRSLFGSLCRNLDLASTAPARRKPGLNLVVIL